MTNNSPIKTIEKLQTPFQTLDPYIITVHHVDYYPEGDGALGPATQEGRGEDGEGVEMKPGTWHMYYGKKIPGFPAHPHRGFETVTVVQQGFIDHSDTAGNQGRYGDGDVQWMTAGSGMQHSEMFPLINEDSKNTCELYQIWLNLPPEKKMVEPAYKMLWAKDIPVRETGEGRALAKVKVVAGPGAVPPAPDSWAADPANHVAIWVINLAPGAEVTLPAVSETLNRAIYLTEGPAAEIASTELPEGHMAILKGDVECLVKNATDSEIELLLLDGEPIGAPVYPEGAAPFVMNTKEEIQETYKEFRETQFGGWPFDTLEPTAPKDAGRFANGSLN